MSPSAMTLEAYARLIARLTAPFAKLDEELASAGLSQLDLRELDRRFLAVMKHDAAARAVFTRAFQGEPDQGGTDVTAHGVFVAGGEALPFVRQPWTPEPMAPLTTPPARTDADPDATQLGGCATGVVLPFDPTRVRAKK